jgi:hypothetical protein
MRNHYHLALETPAPNLVEGMHWLQSTFGTYSKGAIKRCSSKTTRR